MSQRLVYVDWFKSLGMFLIIWGHFFPPHISKYIYAVNVPVFFFASGYLNKSFEDWRLWWHRQLRSLVVPYSILCLVNILLGYFINGFDSPTVLVRRLYLCLLGFNCRNGIDGCGTLWFVYALFIIRLIDKLTPSQYKIVMIVVMLVLGFLLGHRDFHSVDYWAVLAVPLCYPIFAAGTYLSGIDFVSTRCSTIVKIFILLISCIAFYYSVRGNGEAYLFNAEYGRSYLRFVLGVLFGICAIGVVCLLLNNVMAAKVEIISMGTFLTMALHGWLIFICKKYLWLIIPNEQIKYFVFSLLILISFIPLIIISKEYFPWLIGKGAK